MNEAGTPQTPGETPGPVDLSKIQQVSKAAHVFFVAATMLMIFLPLAYRELAGAGPTVKVSRAGGAWYIVNLVFLPAMAAAEYVLGLNARRFVGRFLPDRPPIVTQVAAFWVAQGFFLSGCISGMYLLIAGENPIVGLAVGVPGIVLAAIHRPDFRPTAEEATQANTRAIHPR